MNKLLNELRYNWLILKMEIQGGYKEVKEILNFENLKEMFERAIENMEETDRYEKQQKEYRKKDILQPNDIVEFKDPKYLGNILKCRVVEVDYDYINNNVVVDLEILESGLKKKYDYCTCKQVDILNNLISIQQPK